MVKTEKTMVIDMKMEDYLIENKKGEEIGMDLSSFIDNIDKEFILNCSLTGGANEFLGYLEDNNLEISILTTYGSSETDDVEVKGQVDFLGSSYIILKNASIIGSLTNIEDTTFSNRNIKGEAIITDKEFYSFRVLKKKTDPKIDSLSYELGVMLCQSYLQEIESSLSNVYGYNVSDNFMGIYSNIDKINKEEFFIGFKAELESLNEESNELSGIKIESDFKVAIELFEIE